ncbi:MAG: HNH endonuclease, partial [Thaumarchaeota archaeon]|nr:HNH endonuclease [Nitrososphaerota archaeon]
RIRVSRLMPEGHGKCVKCGIEATRVVTYTLASEQHQVIYSNIFAGTRMMTADHILPRALGGADALTNLQLMCYKCNSKKGMMPSLEEMEMIKQNCSLYIRSTFTKANMRHILRLFPTLYGLYDLEGEEDGPAKPFKRSLWKQPSPTGSRMSKIEKETGGLVNSQHPHHPMWGWVRVFQTYPDIRPVVRFTE